MLGSLKQNISFAFRTLLKNKGFTITAVLTLALGIGSTTAIFSVVYAVFEPMPYPNPDQLVMVWGKVPGGRAPVPANDLLAWRERSSSFQAMNAWNGTSFNVATDDRPEQVPASRRTPGFFTMEGLPMLLGRDFVPEEGDQGRDRVVILSHRFWSKHFHSNRDLIGKDIRMNGEPYTVVGVLVARHVRSTQLAVVCTARVSRRPGRSRHKLHACDGTAERRRHHRSSTGRDERNCCSTQ